MLIKNEGRFCLVFFTLLNIELIVGSFETLQSYRYFTKPTILISLIVFFAVQGSSLSTKVKFLTIAGLFFSLVGDVALLFDSKAELFFLIGLLGFLIAHFAYIFLFQIHKNKEIKVGLFSLVIILVAGSIFVYLLPNLDGLVVPVIIYIAAISTMVVMAYSRKGSVNSASYKLVLVGAILFLISDALLAINKFSQPIPLSHISVMGTYSLAQLGITLGILKLKN